MKANNLIASGVVCIVLVTTQAVAAEEQTIGAEGLSFAFDNVQTSLAKMSELGVEEMDETVGALTISNNGNWGDTWTQTGIGAAAGGATSGGYGAAAGAGAGFGSSFTYDWSTPGYQVNPGSSAWGGGNTGSWNNGTYEP